MLFGIHPLIALGVLASTAATDAAYVFFNAAVSGRNLGTAAASSGVTDGGGRYLLIHLQPGGYSLEISGTGFRN